MSYLPENDFSLPSKQPGQGLQPYQRLPRIYEHLPDPITTTVTTDLRKELTKLEKDHDTTLGIEGVLSLLDVWLSYASINSLLTQHPNLLAIIGGVVTILLTTAGEIARREENKDIYEKEVELEDHTLETRRQAFLALSPSDREQILVNDDELVALYTVHNLLAKPELKFGDVVDAIGALELNIDFDPDEYEKEGGNDKITLDDVRVTRDVLRKRSETLHLVHQNDKVKKGIQKLSQELDIEEARLLTPTRRRLPPKSL